MFNDLLHEKYEEKGVVTAKNGNYKTILAISKEIDKVDAMNQEEFNEYISSGGIFDAPNDNIYLDAKGRIVIQLTSMLAQHTANTASNGVVMGWKGFYELGVQVGWNNDNSVYEVNYDWANQVSNDASTYNVDSRLTQFVPR